MRTFNPFPADATDSNTTASFILPIIAAKLKETKVYNT